MGSHFANEARNIPSTSYHAMVQEIHVLLVDHDTESLMNTAKMLEMCSYRVTVAEMASAAISALSSGKAKFDIVIANVNSPDLHGFKLLQQAVNMEIPVILMSADDNAHMATSALENGAFLVIKKPATMEILRCLWQHVYKEKVRAAAEKERFREIMAYRNRGRPGMDDKNPTYIFGGKGQAKEKFKGQKGDEGWYYKDRYNLVINSDGNKDSGKGVKRKVCTEWTEELHAKFVQAVAQLGEGRCFPKEILELMDTPGLTRMQVASHLQKCRNNNWQSSEGRRAHFTSPHMFRDPNWSNEHKPRKFGSMPLVVPAHRSPHSRQASEIQSDNENQNNLGNVRYTPSITTDASDDEDYEQFEPGPSNTSRSYVPSPDDFFIFQDPACPPIPIYSSVPQGSKAPKQSSSPIPSPHHEHDQACPEQDSAVAGVDSKSQWSPETSNVGGDGSEPKANIKND